MKKSTEFIQERAAHIEAQKRLHENAEKEKRDSLSEDESKEFRELQGKIEALNEKIKDAEAYEANVRSLARTAPSVMPVTTEAGDGGEKREKGKLFGGFRITRALSQEKRGKGLTGIESEVNQIAQDELRALGLDVPDSGISIPAAMMRGEFRASGQSATEDGGEYGGVLVNDGPGETLLPFLPRLTVEDLGVKVITGLTGKYPLYSSEEFEFQNLGETDEATATKIKYKRRVLDALRSACVAHISNQLLIQSSIDVENDVRSNIGRALNRRVFRDMIYGIGDDTNPLGILNDDILESVLPQGPITLAKVLELQDLLDDVDASDVALAYLTRGRVVNIAQQTKVDAGSGIMLADKDGSLWGNKTFKSSMIQSAAGSAGATVYPLIYGDWSTARSLFWGGANFVSDPYTKAASGELRLVINVYKNSGVSNPNAFAVNKLITLS